MLSMAHCIGRSGCVDDPNAGRGLCRSCYARHRSRGTLLNFPTMRERIDELRQQGWTSAALTRQKFAYSTPEAQRVANAKYRRALYRERVLIDGVLIHPTAQHGRLTSYNVYGCRGPLCLQSQRHYRRTRETVLPCALKRSYTWQDCLDYKSGML